MEVAGPRDDTDTQIVAVEIADPSQVGEARRAATKLATEVELDETAVGRVAIAVTEMGTNILKHATRGEIIVRSDRGPVPTVELLAIDSGPGIADVERALRDGYSTAGSSGGGLGALARLANTFDVFTAPGKGTILLARVGPGSRPLAEHALALGVVRVPKVNESVCGDDWRLTNYPSSAALLVVADGLGHGVAAADASGLAVRVASSGREFSAAEAMNATHGALRSTRGAAGAAALIAADHRSIRFSGVGNISACIVERGSVKTMVSHNGILGHSARRIQEFEYHWPASALLVMHSDGVSGRWDLDDYPGLGSRDPSIIAAVLYRDFTRRHDDAIVIVVRAAD